MSKTTTTTHISRGLFWQGAMALMINILSLAMPIFMLQIYDRIIPHKSYGTLLFMLGGVLVALCGDAALRLMRGALAGRVAVTNEHVAGTNAMRRILAADLAAFEAETPGAHLQNMNAFGKLREFYSGQALMGMIDLPFAAVFIGMIAYLSPRLALVPLVLLTVFTLSAVLAGGHLKKTINRRSIQDEKKTSALVSVLSSIHTAKALGMEKALLRRFETLQEAATTGSYRLAIANGNTAILSAMFGQLSFIATATFGCWLVVHGQLTVGGLSACSLLAGRAMQPIQRVLAAWLRVHDLNIAKAQTQQVLGLRQRRFAAPSANVPQGRVSLRDMCYNDLKEVSLDIAHGEVIAITGAKGSGKSTLLQLIAGVMPPGSGTITVDDINPARQLMTGNARYVGYMPQQGTVFQGSIIDNISGFSRDDRMLTKSRMAAQLLGIDEIVNILPRGYQTQLQDNQGDPVPPGVKQRISLARVLAHQPGLLLFDDADRALDKEGYNRLFRLLGRLKGNCSMVIVSHDLNLLSFADRTFHLENGCLKPVSVNTANNITFMPASFREKAIV